MKQKIKGGYLGRTERVSFTSDVEYLSSVNPSPTDFKKEDTKSVFRRAPTYKFNEIKGKPKSLSPTPAPGQYK